MQEFSHGRLKTQLLATIPLSRERVVRDEDVTVTIFQNISFPDRP